MQHPRESEQPKVHWRHGGHRRRLRVRPPVPAVHHRAGPLLHRAQHLTRYAAVVPLRLLRVPGGRPPQDQPRPLGNRRGVRSHLRHIAKHRPRTGRRAGGVAVRNRPDIHLHRPDLMRNDDAIGPATRRGERIAFPRPGASGAYIQMERQHLVGGLAPTLRQLEGRRQRCDRRHLDSVLPDPSGARSRYRRQGHLLQRRARSPCRSSRQRRRGHLSCGVWKACHHRHLRRAAEDEGGDRGGGRRVPSKATLPTRADQERALRHPDGRCRPGSRGHRRRRRLPVYGRRRRPRRRLQRSRRRGRHRRCRRHHAGQRRQDRQQVVQQPAREGHRLRRRDYPVQARKRRLRGGRRARRPPAAGRPDLQRPDGALGTPEGARHPRRRRGHRPRRHVRLRLRCEHADRPEPRIPAVPGHLRELGEHPAQGRGRHLVLQRRVRPGAHGGRVQPRFAPSVLSHVARRSGSRSGGRLRDHLPARDDGRARREALLHRDGVLAPRRRQRAGRVRRKRSHHVLHRRALGG